MYCLNLGYLCRSFLFFFIFTNDIFTNDLYPELEQDRAIATQMTEDFFNTSPPVMPEIYRMIAKGNIDEINKILSLDTIENLQTDSSLIRHTLIAAPENRQEEIVDLLIRRAGVTFNDIEDKKGVNNLTILQSEAQFNGLGSIEKYINKYGYDKRILDVDSIREILRARYHVCNREEGVVMPYSYTPFTESECEGFIRAYERIYHVSKKAIKKASEGSGKSSGEFNILGYIASNNIAIVKKFLDSNPRNFMDLQLYLDIAAKRELLNMFMLILTYINNRDFDKRVKSCMKKKIKECIKTAYQAENKENLSLELKLCRSKGDIDLNLYECVLEHVRR